MKHEHKNTHFLMHTKDGDQVSHNRSMLEFKTQMSNVVRTTGFWNNRHRVRPYPNNYITLC